MAAQVGARTGPVLAAGCVVWRTTGSDTEVLLVHRPRYDDWSFPKGKLDPGEDDLGAAVREVAEETGLPVRLGPRLPDQHYTIATGQEKVVAYWAAQPLKHADISSYERNDEIDDLRWLPLPEAVRRLTHPRDAELLGAFEQVGFDSAPLLVVRHAHARSRKGWRGDDSERPLKALGRRQAHDLVSLLGAYGVTRVLSSDAARCVETLLPYLNSARVEVRLQGALSQERADRATIDREVSRAMQTSRRIALCSHRPVLPFIFDTIGIEPIALEPAGVVVVHRDDQGKVVGVEQHRPLVGHL